MNEFENLLEAMIAAKERHEYYANRGFLSGANAEYETYLALKARLIEFSKAVARIWEHTERIQVYGVNHFIDKQVLENMIKEAE